MKIHVTLDQPGVGPVRRFFFLFLFEPGRVRVELAGLYDRWAGVQIFLGTPRLVEGYYNYSGLFSSLLLFPYYSPFWG